MTRVLLFTGKGGVGKTTVAAATAVRGAARGHRVLVTSTDPAHSLADVFDVPLGDTPTAVAPGLDALQIDAQARLEARWDRVRDYLVQLLTWGGAAQVEAEELVVVPGLDELFALVDLAERARAGTHDVVVIDCAPTAETLRLLALPDALRWYANRVLGAGRRMARAVRPLTSRVGGPPVPEDDVFGVVERLYADLAAVHALLQDPARSSVRLVLTPERLVVNETLRTATTLGLFGYALDAVVANRILPDGVTDPYLLRWREQQAEHLAAVDASFAPVPVLRAEMAACEPHGSADLAVLADDLYRDADETAVLHRQRPIEVAAVDDGHVLRVTVPFVTTDDVVLHRRADVLHVKVAGAKRTIALPAALRRADVAGARVRDGMLEVRFAAPIPAAVGS